MHSVLLEPIAYIHTDFSQKFGIPRQSGLVSELEAQIEMCPPYGDPQAFRGLETFSHIWLLWGFSENKKSTWSATVRPPRLGGNARMGVFATRSPYRPNAIGLSSVELIRIEFSRDKTTLFVRGADLLDGTPIYDIKPYLPYTDRHSNAQGGFSDAVYDYQLQVECPAPLLEKIPPQKRQALLDVLRQDPRPQYQKDPLRVYGMPFSDWEVHFSVANDILTVQEILPR